MPPDGPTASGVGMHSSSTHARFSELAEREVPDARQRLVHVMKLTDDAAHRTMDLIERAAPLATTLVSTAADPTAPAVVTASAQLRSHLSDVYLAQGYQDLSGQISRRRRKTKLRRRSRGHPREPDAYCRRGDRKTDECRTGRSQRVRPHRTRCRPWGRSRQPAGRRCAAVGSGSLIIPWVTHSMNNNTDTSGASPHNCPLCPWG